MTNGKRRVFPVCHMQTGVDGRCYRHYAAPGRRNYELTARQAYVVSHCYVCDWPLCLDRAAHPDGAVCHNPGCRKYVVKPTRRKPMHINDITPEHLGVGATEATAQQFRRACDAFIDLHYDSVSYGEGGNVFESEVVDYVWNGGDFAARIIELLGEDIAI